MTDRYLKQLGEGWTKAEDGSYRRHINATESVKIVRVADGWVILFCLNGNPNYGHHHPSFRKLVQSFGN